MRTVLAGQQIISECSSAFEVTVATKFTLVYGPLFTNRDLTIRQRRQRRGTFLLPVTYCA